MKENGLVRGQWTVGVAAVVLVLACLAAGPLSAAPPASSRGSGNLRPPNPQAVAAKVDRLILAELQKAGIQPAPLTNDHDFLRRVTLDLAGRLPTPQEITQFSQASAPRKRAAKIDELLQSDDYAENWAHYWRDVIFTDATNMQARLMQDVFERWMAEHLRQNRPWDEIAAELLTATGDIQKNGATALMVANAGDPAEIAAETSRIFLGIQMQCANCHDHPTDIWTRQQFHELAAYFPRVSVRQTIADGQRTLVVASVDSSGNRFAEQMRQNPQQFIAQLDRNRDGKISRDEARQRPQFARVFDALVELGDSNKDGALSAQELSKLPPPQQQGRGSLEYLMPDLDDPSSPGTAVQPVFFVDNWPEEPGLDDLSRRSALVKRLTAPENPWFARAMVNRMWNALLGEGFYTPVDDLGPQREPRFPAVLETLCDGFTASGYDIQWLLQTITRTKAYQRQIGERRPGDGTLPFASALPTRLRADQIYTALTQVLDAPELGGGAMRRGPAAGTQPGRQSARGRFNTLFGIDPSAPQEEVVGDVPQALYMMNSSALRGMIRARGRTRLARLLRQQGDDRQAIDELYLVALSREPTRQEQQICLNYIDEVGSREEAFEDLLWSLINTSEFVSRR